MDEIIGLSVDLLERLGILAVLFFLMLRFEPFRRLLTGHATLREKAGHAVFFGAAGIFATYCGFPMHGAIANLRTVPVVIGGILGGPLVGLAAGLIAGLHRYFYDLGGVTSLSCAIATPLSGLLAGVVYRSLQSRNLDSLIAFGIGMLAESLKMVLILLLARPPEAGQYVVHTIGLPSIFANAFGVAVLLEVISSVLRDQDRVVAHQAQTTLNIAFRTLPFLRHGLTAESAGAAARIIRELTGLDAVAFFSAEELLAHEGVDGERHRTGAPGVPLVVRRALESGAVVTARDTDEVGYPARESRLRCAIAVPLSVGEKGGSVMALYRVQEHAMSRLDLELAHGLAHLFSNQLELGEIELQRKLVAEAEIKALQAQINPHFLFNAISTIISYTRTDPRTASVLLVKLAEFFRKNISPTASQVPLSLELEHCEAYLAIEKARFEERLSIVYQVEEPALTCKVPSLILQPLVENGVRHGILPREGGGVIRIAARREADELLISVEDNGVGIPPERLAALLSEGSRLPSSGLGLALKNVNGRLTTLYGKDRALTIESTPGGGTTVSFSIPVAA
ncbi:histidine kinase [Geomonas silvestris]|uniref:histidine kinase n=1 Tax=Geomonas silvestris TaxID=2740184 RepID=A0A6V8MM79_9BACT|nr:LytS/YhcK type 5TM receptor domain-containing protein [Geomonas silvestris]GFO61151.1 histidine kinase [Geomonas silvestris]